MRMGKESESLEESHRRRGKDDLQHGQVWEGANYIASQIACPQFAGVEDGP